MECVLQTVTSAYCLQSNSSGLLTVRYQNRFGHEFNVPPVYSQVNGLSLQETTIADVFEIRRLQDHCAREMAPWIRAEISTQCSVFHGLLRLLAGVSKLLSAKEIEQPESTTAGS